MQHYFKKKGHHSSKIGKGRIFARQSGSSLPLTNIFDQQSAR
jgi:hypothetical protein